MYASLYLSALEWSEGRCIVVQSIYENCVKLIFLGMQINREPAWNAIMSYQRFATPSRN